MRLFIDLDTRSFVESPQFPRTLQSVSLKRRDRMPLDIQFLRNNSVVELSSGATGKLGLKAEKDFNGSFIAADTEWTEIGEGDNRIYRFDLDLNTIQVDSLFAGIPTPSVVAAMLEVEWLEEDRRTSSQTLVVNIDNDVVRGDEGIPENAEPPYPAPGDIELTQRKGQPEGYAPLTRVPQFVLH